MNWRKINYAAITFISVCGATLGSQEVIPDGHYRIYCDTRNEGRKYLEAYPGDDLVRLKGYKNAQDQLWKVAFTEDKCRISCHTQRDGILSMEAFPKDDVVRPRRDSTHQDQVWILQSFPHYTATYYILCNTLNKGRLVLEAYPGDGKVRFNSQSLDQDQIWRFEKVL
jgi:hypothetical protein